LRYAGSILLALFIQLIQKNFSIIRAKRILMKQDRHCLQSRVFQSRKNLLEFKLKIALFVPLVAVDKSNLIHANQHNKTRRFSCAKEDFCNQVLVCYLTQNALVKCTGSIVVHIVGIEHKALHNTRIRFFRC
jgi:hypothetical protein